MNVHVSIIEEFSAAREREMKSIVAGTNKHSSSTAEQVRRVEWFQHHLRKVAG